MVMNREWLKRETLYETMEGKFILSIFITKTYINNYYEIRNFINFN